MTTRDVFKDLVAEAIKAPSSHNTQPWIFELRDDHLLLCADRTRALPVNDPQDRELTISCGCALMNLQVAAAARGHSLRVQTWPDPDDPDLLARIEIGGAPDTALAPLAAGIDTRHTYRKAFGDRPVSSDDITALQDAAGGQGVRLLTVQDPAQRNALADLVAQGDTALWDDPRWRRELAAWMHPRRRGDGLTLPWLAVPVAQLVVRSFDMGDGQAARDRQIAEASPLLAVLVTDDDRAANWLAAGQALQRILLTAATRGMQASYLNQPVQVADLRAELARIAGDPLASPQVVLRFGHVTEAPVAAPRRPLDDVLIESEG